MSIGCRHDSSLVTEKITVKDLVSLDSSAVMPQKNVVTITTEKEKGAFAVINGDTVWMVDGQPKDPEIKLRA